jgi:inorganic pyrophosphatase
MTEIEKMAEFALTINFNNLSESQKIKEIKDLPAQTLHEIMGFFKQYNALEKKKFRVSGIKKANEANEIIIANRKNK